jgi:hypothetical protein
VRLNIEVDVRVREATHNQSLPAVEESAACFIVRDHTGKRSGKGGGVAIEPAIEEMSGFMSRSQFAIASHMTELAEEILSYHHDEDYKIVKLRDDLISAVRYAFMAWRSGKALGDCELYGRAPGTDPGIYDPRPPRPERRDTQFARGTAGHPEGSYDLFSGR